MFVRWSLHSKHMFAERAVKLGINYGDVELEIKKQRVKVREEKNKFRTIFQAGGSVLTAIKIETNEFIHVLTLWEANEKEVELWRKK
ncbi:MAG: hypothetical protein V1494_07235 [Candidatus Diapherotrites archaeon]